MKNPLGTILALAVIVTLAVFAYCAISLTKHFDATLDATRDTITAIKLPTQKLEASWAATGLTAAQTLAKERDAFAAQSKQATDVGAASVKFLSAATQTVKGVNDSQAKVAQALIADSTTATSAISETAKHTGLAVDGISQSVSNLISSSQRAMDAATAQLSSPAIADTLTNVDATSKSVASMAVHMDATAKDTADYVHRFTKPPTKASQFLQALEQAVFLGIKIAY